MPPFAGAQGPEESAVRIGFYLYTALAAAGVFVSEMLIKTHIRSVYQNATDSGVCAASDLFSCAEAARSWLSSIGSLPVAALGEAFYLTLLVLAAIQRFSPRSLPGLPDVFYFSSLLSVLYSAFLAIAGKITVGKFCPECMYLYAVNVGLFATAWATHPDGAGSAFRNVFKVFTTKAFWTSVALVGVAVLITQNIYATRARAASEDYAKKQAALGAAPPKHYDVVVGDAPGSGAANAPVVVVEFSDFECPYCGRLAAGLKEAAAQRPELVRYHFKHYPMDSACNPNISGKFHENACAAAAAAICAQQQGKFWEMHDKMFENRTRLGPAELAEYAAALGLDVERFNVCRVDPATTERIRKDIAQGDQVGVDGTPTWFVNGWQMMGARKADDLIGIFEQAKRDAEKKAPASAP
jgi:protein-disulfide isomerase/uncharacterized membrane protein